MAFGMRVWGDDGQLQIDENSFTMRVVHSVILTPQNWTPGSKYLDVPVAGITAANAAAFVTPIQPVTDQWFDVQCEPAVATGYVRVWRTIRGDPYGNSSSTGRAQRLVVVRFR